MLPLCDVLDITVNDLLSGATISQTNYQKKAEAHLSGMRQNVNVQAPNCKIKHKARKRFETFSGFFVIFQISELSTSVVLDAVFM